MVNTKSNKNVLSANSRTTARNNGGCCNLNKRLQQIEFALADVILYLDAYPNCDKALEYYHRLLAERDELLDAINTQCGPMTNFSNVSTQNWQWIDGPWPWQSEAN